MAKFVSVSTFFFYACFGFGVLHFFDLVSTNDLVLIILTHWAINSTEACIIRIFYPRKSKQAVPSSKLGKYQILFRPLLFDIITTN